MGRTYTYKAVAHWIVKLNKPIREQDLHTAHCLANHVLAMKTHRLFQDGGWVCKPHRADFVILCFMCSYLLNLCISDILYLQDEDEENSDDGESMFLVAYIAVYVWHV